MSVVGILELIGQLEAYRQLEDRLAVAPAGPPLYLPQSARPAVLAELSLTLRRPIFLLVGRVETASAWQQALEAWLPPGRQPDRLAEPTPLPNDRAPWSGRTRQGRLSVLSRLLAGAHPQIPEAATPPFVIGSARAFLHKTVGKRKLLTATRVLRRGQRISLERSLETWAAIGYEAVSVVEEAGQISQRGGILDIFAIGSPFPVRVELFGDEIESMRFFDPATQRSIEADNGELAGGLVVPPAREALPSAAQAYAQILDDELLPSATSLPSWRDDITKLKRADVFPELEYYLPLIYPRPATILDYLPEDSLVVIDDWRELEQAVFELHDHASQILEEQPDLPPGYSSALFEWGPLAAELRWWQPLILGAGEESEGVPTRSSSATALADAFESGPRYGGQTRPLINQIKAAMREGERVVLVSQQASRLAEVWREEQRRPGTQVDVEGVGLDNGEQGDAASSPLTLSQPAAANLYLPLPVLNELPSAGSLTFVQGSLAEGFTLVERRQNKVLLNLLSDAELFGWNRPAPRRWRAPQALAPETRFADIAAGDFVVHLEYGIGQFEGLVIRGIGGTEREYLLVKYANGDVLYVPVHHADRMSKWIGPDERPPVLHRLGERSWSRAKAKAQSAADELADELLDLYSARETVPGHAFSRDNEWQAELEASFPYRETEDQLRVIAEVKADMERPQPMDRLVCGDVGYGKTEVALRAAFKAVLDGKQAAILVPTTVLAQQHYNTFRERLTPFPMNVEMLSRFRTIGHQERIVKGLRSGEVDIVIGTHRLLSEDVSFKDLGLVIIDEEQRFGVAHKERLKQWRTEVDVLTMTATPIPRTLHMSLTGVRDISIIDTAPADRLPVQTFVGEADDSRLKRALLRELDRGGQVFFVHNRVQTIDIVARRLGQLIPEARIAVGHGQMSERQLEQIMVQFAQGEIDVLLSTTIIESGLDFPNANTLIVDRADMFGLSQLYQLRGRVGRGARRAYACFFHRPWHSLTPEARARLDTIAEQTQLGSGFAIAMRDMEIRGAGELLGAQQSGHMALVGFDLYTRLLSNAVKKKKAERRGETVPAELPEATLIDLPMATYVPTDYIPDASLRLRLYRRMALLSSLEEIDEMADELADRFGPIPDPVHNLLYHLRVKVLAQKAQVTAVTSESGQVKVRLPGINQVNRFRAQRHLGAQVRVSRTAIWLDRALSTREWQIALVQVLERLEGFEWQLQTSS